MTFCHDLSGITAWRDGEANLRHNSNLEKVKSLAQTYVSIWSCKPATVAFLDPVIPHATNDVFPLGSLDVSCRGETAICAEAVFTRLLPHDTIRISRSTPWHRECARDLQPWQDD